MAFTVKLMPHNTMVTIKDGPHRGKEGQVVGWGEIGPEVDDVVHMVDVEHRDPGRGGYSRYEVPFSHLIEAGDRIR